MKKVKETPLMAQYNAIKSQHPDAILLFRVGDFYETFGKDAIKASEVLGITLTARNNGSSKIELAGFPHHSMPTYLPKLVQSGLRVAVCDQLEKPSKLKKIVKRGVTEVVTPGVTLNETILDYKKNNFLAAIHKQSHQRFGLSLLDISTGEFYVTEGQVSYIDNLMQSYQPAEVIYQRGLKKEIESLWADSFYMYPLDDWIFQDTYCYEKLTEHFQVNSLKGYGIDESKACYVAAGAALHYLGTTENKNLQHIRSISRLEADQFVWMDKFTIRNLELLFSNHPSGVSLLDVIDRTITAMGGRLLKKWLVNPLKSIDAINERLDIVRFLSDQTPMREDLTTHFSQIGDLERLITKVPMGKINPREVKHLHHSLQTCGLVKSMFAKSKNDLLMQQAELLDPCDPLIEKIQTTLLDEVSVKTDRGQLIRDGFNDEVDELRRLIKNSKDVLLEVQMKEIEKTGIDNLKVGFNNVFGYYFEVTNKHKDKGLVPDHWVRKQTLTNAERYISQDLKDLETKILQAEERIVILEQQLFMDLVFEINSYIANIQQNAACLAKLDCLNGFAQLVIDRHYCRPYINDSTEISIKAGRHPVIETQLSASESYIPNDIYLSNDDQQIIMITGPNMSGKSAILRQTALICLLAQIGCFVPATEAKIGWVDKIFTRVGASDNISSGESTFMVEMNETASILNNMTDRSLILLDEIGRGTSTFDGISIAWAIGEFLHNNDKARPKTLFATHYHELNLLENLFDRIKNFHVSTREFNQKIIFLRKLERGGKAHSFGIHVARLAGMPSQVLQRASEILQQLEQAKMDETLGGSIEKKLSTVEAPVQLTMFGAQRDPILDAIKEAFLELDINRMTPLECMQKLDELQRLFTEGEA